MPWKERKMRSDVVYRRPCCGVSVTVHGTQNGDEAYAETEALRMVRELCHCVGEDASTEIQQMPAQWSYATPGGKALVVSQPPKRRKV